MADELSSEHEVYFRKVFEEFDEDGNRDICKEVGISRGRSFACSWGHSDKTFRTTRSTNS